MDIYEETKLPLQAIWRKDTERQQAKLVIMSAIGSASDVPVKVAEEILRDLDRLLLDEEEETERITNPGL